MKLLKRLFGLSLQVTGYDHLPARLHQRHGALLYYARHGH